MIRCRFDQIASPNKTKITWMLFSFAVTLVSLLVNRITFYPFGRFNYFRVDIFPGVDNLDPSVLLLPDTSNPIPNHREHSDKCTDPKSTEFQENYQSYLVPTKTTQDHDLNNVMESVIPPTPENVQLNSSIPTDINNETKSDDHAKVTDTVHHPRYFSLLSYLEYKVTLAVANGHDSTNDCSPNSTSPIKPKQEYAETDSVVNESTWYSGLVSVINTNVALAKELIGGFISLFKVRNVQEALMEYRGIGEKISLMIKYYDDHNPSICPVYPFNIETQFDIFTYANDLDLTLKKLRALLDEINEMGYSLSFGLGINVDLVARGNETLKQAVKSIYFKYANLISKDQEQLNEYADKVIDIILTEKACVSDNQCDLEDVQSRLLDSLKIFKEKEESIRGQRYARYIKDFNFRPYVHSASSNFLEFLQQKIEQIRLEKLDGLMKERLFVLEKIAFMVGFFDSLFLPSDSKVCPLPVLTSLLNEEAMFLFDLPSFVKDLEKTRDRYWLNYDEIKSIEDYPWRKFKVWSHHHESFMRSYEITGNEFGRAKDLKQHFDDLWLITKHIAGRIQNYDSHCRNEDFDNIPFAQDLFKNIEKGNSLFDKLNDMGFELSFTHWNIYQRGNQVMKEIVSLIRMEKKDSIQQDQQDLIDKTREISEFINGKSECFEDVNCDLDKVKSHLELKLKHYQEACDGYIQIFLDTKEMKSKVDLISSEFFNQIQMAVENRKTLKLDPIRKERNFVGEKLKFMLAQYDYLFTTTEIKVCPLPTLETFFIEELRSLFDLPSFVKDLRMTRGRYWWTWDEIKSKEKDAHLKFEDFHAHHESYLRSCKIIDTHESGSEVFSDNFDRPKFLGQFAAFVLSCVRAFLALSMIVFGLLLLFSPKWRMKFVAVIYKIKGEFHNLLDKYRLWKKLMDPGTLCLFCHEEHRLRDSVITKCCGHVYGEKCLRPLLIDCNRCPMCKINEPKLMKLTAFGSHLQSFTMTVNIDGRKIQLNQMKQWVERQILRERNDLVLQMIESDMQDEQLSMNDGRARVRDQIRIFEAEDRIADVLLDDQIDMDWDLWPGKWRDLIARLRRRNVYVGI